LRSAIAAFLALGYATTRERQPMYILFATRFSILDRNGAKHWQLARTVGDYDAYRDVLFDDLRLEVKFACFERLTVPSMASQKLMRDQRMRWLVFASPHLPEPYRLRLLAAVSTVRCGLVVWVDSVAEFDAHVDAEVWRLERTGATFATVRLDDDDGLAAHYCATLAKYASASPGEIVSFVSGRYVGVRVVEENTAVTFALGKISQAPYNAFGTAMIGGNVYRAGNHRRLAERFVVHLDQTPEMWLAACSHLSDSQRGVRGVNHNEPFAVVIIGDTREKWSVSNRNDERDYEDSAIAAIEAQIMSEFAEHDYEAAAAAADVVEEERTESTVAAEPAAADVVEEMKAGERSEAGQRTESTVAAEPVAADIIEEQRTESTVAAEPAAADVVEEQRTESTVSAEPAAADFVEDQRTESTVAAEPVAADVVEEERPESTVTAEPAAADVVEEERPESTVTAEPVAADVVEDQRTESTVAAEPVATDVVEEERTESTVAAEPAAADVVEDQRTESTVAAEPAVGEQYAADWLEEQTFSDGGEDDDQDWAFVEDADEVEEAETDEATAQNDEPEEEKDASEASGSTRNSKNYMRLCQDVAHVRLRAHGIERLASALVRDRLDPAVLAMIGETPSLRSASANSGGSPPAHRRAFGAPRSGSSHTRVTQHSPSRTTQQAHGAGNRSLSGSAAGAVWSNEAHPSPSVRSQPVAPVRSNLVIPKASPPAASSFSAPGAPPHQVRATAAPSLAHSVPSSAASLQQPMILRALIARKAKTTPRGKVYGLARA